MARKPKNTGKSSRGPVLEEVADLESEPAAGPGHTIETGLIFVTFLALLVGIVLAQMALKKYYDAGLFA